MVGQGQTTIQHGMAQVGEEVEMAVEVEMEMVMVMVEVDELEESEVLEGLVE